MTGYTCKSCGGPSPIGVGYAITNPTQEDQHASEDRIACDCGHSITAAGWAVFNVAVTQILGLYSTEDRATEAAREFGSCSFAYRLSADEAARISQTH
ncbi:MAG: hypothetical protein ACTH8F_08290 [Microbacterium sp.]|uniref:hypothetical protein n=1 Tax=Microbacterium sp. TaxID=51671 RepID=UPI003F97814D